MYVVKIPEGPVTAPVMVTASDREKGPAASLVEGQAQVQIPAADPVSPQREAGAGVAEASPPVLYLWIGEPLTFTLFSLHDRQLNCQKQVF